IFLPTRLACSITSTRRPRWPAVNAHINPAAPPPTMIASWSCATSADVMPSLLPGRDQQAQRALDARRRRPALAVGADHVALERDLDPDLARGDRVGADLDVGLGRARI